MSEYKIEQFGPLQVKYLHKDNFGGEPLVFLHGYGVPPKHYEHFLDKLATNYEVIAPVAYGINCFKSQPSSIDEYAELTSEFSRKVFRGKAHFVGHSLGGSIAIVSSSHNKDISDIVAINPLLPIDYSVWGFSIRALYKGNREILGIDGEKSSTKFGLVIPIPFGINLVKDLGSSYKLIRDICDFNYEGIKIEQPTLFLYGEDDEYFRLHEKNEDLLKKTASNGRVKRIPKRNHDWPIFNPDQASEEVNQFIFQLRNS
tara:strand:- start:1103 stop:1876 length:774 start_codon:yes stop_codon:yes gene_type:complete